MTSAGLKPFRSAWLWALPLAFLGAFYFFPLVRIFETSLGRGDGAGPAAFLLAPGTLSVLWFTLWQAVVSVLLTLLAGLPGAYILARFDFRGKAVFRAITGVPFVMPTLVVAAAFSALLGPQGWVNSALMAAFNLEAAPIQFLNTIWAILAAHVFYNLTIVLRLVGDFWARLDPRLGLAAHSLGAGNWKTFRRVTAPLLLPAVLAAALLIFIFDFSSFAVVLLLGGIRFATLEVEIYYRTSALFDLPAAALLSLLQLGATLALTVAFSRLSTKVARPLDQGRKPEKGRALAWPHRLYLWAVLLFTGSPLLALLLRSVTQLGQSRSPDGDIQQGLTTLFFRTLFDGSRNALLTISPVRSIGVTLAYALITVVLALIVGLPAAWALSRRHRTALDQVLDPILMLPLGTSAVTLGLGFLIALDRPPLDLRASPILVPLAHSLVAFPFVVRSLVPALSSIQPKLGQAASVLGAGPAQVLRRIDLPLVGRGILVAATFAFMISIGEFGATALIVRPEYQTLPAAIFRLLGRPGALNYGQGLALSAILMLVTGSGMLLIEKIRLGAGAEF